MPTGHLNESNMSTYKSPTSDRSYRSDESSPVVGATSTAAPVSASKDRYSDKDDELEYARIEIRRLQATIKHIKETTRIQSHSWSQERKALHDNLARLNKSVKNRLNTIHLGRNKIRKSKFDGYDYTNSAHISTTLKYNIMPHIKFWPISWLYYTPEECSTLCAQMLDDIEIPADEDTRVYWDKRIVGMINNKLVDWRSQVVTRCLDQYRGDMSFKSFIVYRIPLLLITYDSFVYYIQLYSGQEE